MSISYLFIVEDLYGGGAQKSLLYTADGLRQRGNAVRVLILRDLIEHRLPEGLEVVNLDVVKPWTKALSNVFVEKWQASRIAKAIKAYGPDVVISCSCDKITRHLRHPNLYFWIKSDISAKFTDPVKRGKAFAKVHRFYAGRKVIAVSEGVRDNLLNIIGLKPLWMKAIYNPYEREPFVSMADEAFVQPAPEYLISVGTFESRKRHDRLLKAYKASGVSLPLVILGKGKPGEEEVIRAQVSELGLDEKVIFPGYQTNPYPYIKYATALILTSDSEGLPRVLIESLMLETPVVSVDCPSGPREILTGELARFLVPMDDETALARAIAEMVREPVKVTEEHYRKFLKETVLPQFESL